MQISIFDFNGISLEVYGTFNKPYFIAKQVAKILNYLDTDDAIRNHVDEDEKILYSKIAYLKRQVPVGMRTLTNETTTKKSLHFRTILISEPGLYSLVLSSKLPMAKEFKKWVCKEVIPSIRKQGEDSMVLELKTLKSQNETLISNKESLESKLEKRERTKYPKGNCIYIVHCPMYPHFYKIGITSNLSARLGNYNTSCPMDFKIKFCRYTKEINAIETLLFYILAIFRVKNSKEWFYTENYNILQREIQTVVDFIDRERNQYNSPNSGFKDIKDVKISEELVIEEAKIEDEKPWIPEINENIAETPDIPQLKICCTCKEEKPLTEFNCNRGQIDGLERRCKPCRRTIGQRVRENYNKKAEMPESKVCLNCKIEKSSSGFWKNPCRKDLLHTVCKICESERLQNLKQIKKEMKDVKICSKCNDTKSISEFYRRATSSDGHTGTCKSCDKVTAKIRKKRKNRFKNIESFIQVQPANPSSFNWVSRFES